MNDRWVAGVKVLNSSGYVDNDTEALLPIHELRALSPEQRVLKIPIGHQFVDQKESPASPVGGEANRNDNVFGPEFRSEEKLVVEFSLALRGGGVHEFDGDGFLRRRKQTGENRPEAAVADPVREGFGGGSEKGVRESMWRRIWFGIGRRGGAFSGTAAKTEESEKEDGPRRIWVDGDHRRRRHDVEIEIQDLGLDFMICEYQRRKKLRN